jgi:hypothetical protein
MSEELDEGRGFVVSESTFADCSVSDEEANKSCRSFTIAGTPIADVSNLEGWSVCDEIAKVSWELSDTLSDFFFLLK